jgi:hypothetical protein
MGDCRAPRSEPAVKDLLNTEIARLLMRADRVERQQVEDLVTRLGAERWKGVDHECGSDSENQG